MRQLLGTLSLVALLQSFPLSVYAQIPTSSTVSFAAIEQVVAANLMNNYPDGNFYPERFISRAELASTLVKAFQLDKRQAATQENVISVPDVPTSHWAYKDIQTVLKTGIMKGYRDNMFFPNQRVTRAEAFAIFAQAYGVFQFPDNTVEEILSTYPDAVAIPTWAKRAMATAVNEGFVNLDYQGNIKPSQPMTRGDMAYALSKYLQRQQKPSSVENLRQQSN
ncbi:MAG: S-layer homology domain-containing protein [Nostocaceae cyanobacterium]|nr:S-layer homology domain-containing protein [Nostocaceae cyanobacterium]